MIGKLDAKHPWTSIQGTPIASLPSCFGSPYRVKPSRPWSDRLNLWTNTPARQTLPPSDRTVPVCPPLQEFVVSKWDRIKTCYHHLLTDLIISRIWKLYNGYRTCVQQMPTLMQQQIKQLQTLQTDNAQLRNSSANPNTYSFKTATVFTKYLYGTYAKMSDTVVIKIMRSAWWQNHNTPLDLLFAVVVWNWTGSLFLPCVCRTCN